eukprot:6198952-Pleurochrysis_carterae.AAC.3
MSELAYCRDGKVDAACAPRAMRARAPTTRWRMWRLRASSWERGGRIRPRTHSEFKSVVAFKSHFARRQWVRVVRGSAHVIYVSQHRSIR